MKKTLIALAALASVGAASAQSSVTLSGTVAAGVQYDRTAAGTSAAPITGRGLTITDAFFNLKGVEDLGGGLSAQFDTKFEQTSKFRGGSANNDGVSTTNNNALRRTDTSVSLSGGFGKVAFIDTRSSDLLTNALVAPAYLDDGIYDSSNVLTRVAIDQLQYGLSFGNGFAASFSYLEQQDGPYTVTTAALPAAATGKTAYVLGGSYINGPLDVKLAYKAIGQKKAGAKDSAELSVVYDFGMAKVGFGYDGAVIEKNVAAPAGFQYYQKDALGVGVSVPFGAFTVGANYAVRGKAKLAEAVAKYNFSKRTALIASWGKQNADAIAVSPTGAKETNQQYRVAVRHDF